MRRSLVSVGAGIVGMALMLAVGTSTAHALTPQQNCFSKIAKAGGKFVKSKLTKIQKCTEKKLKTPSDTCDSTLFTVDIPALATKLQNDLQNSDCATLNGFDYGQMGFPGKCTDPNPGDGFTIADLKACIRDSHENIVDAADTTPAASPRGGLMDVEYGTVTGPITDSDLLNCQKAVTKNGAKFLNAKLKAVQKCRNGLLTGKINGSFAPKDCATAEPDTAAKIASAESKARSAILAKCSTVDLTMLDICNGAATETAVENCIITTHGNAADQTSLTELDLIDFEFASPGVCGDGVINTLDEECDGASDAACFGQCGGPASAFPCLCLTKKRERVIEHANADLDNGWTGLAHDQGIQEGGGYVEDIYDCNGVSGPDTICTVGPSCTIPAFGDFHSACSNNANCGANGPCRKERTAVGPHCNLNVQVACTSDGQCTGAGNFCVKQNHGPPLPLAAGAVSVCVVNVFTEDVVGTTDLFSGDSSIRLRQDSNTFLENNIPTPCPVCGGFCTPASDTDQLTCATNADCPSPQTCVTIPICSRGPNHGQECRPAFPFGGTSALFGTTSVDCPPDAGNKIATIDILFNPATTGTVTKVPTFHCPTATGFGGKTCAGGTSNGRNCTVASECPSGTCSEQCYCPGTRCQAGPNVNAVCAVNSECPSSICISIGTSESPNQCDAACVGGINNTNGCVSDGDCTGGFCHKGDCRDAGLPDPQEGVCTSGPGDNICSLHTFKGCTIDAECKRSLRCQGGPNGNAVCTTATECPGSQCLHGCEFCLESETCVLKQRECFVNNQILKTGMPDQDDPQTVAVFCETPTTNPATNNTAGLPGPAAIRQPTTIVRTALP